MSSSALINKTKRVLDYDLVSSKRHEPEGRADKAPVNDIIPVSARPPINDGLSRIGASNSDLPHHKPAQYPKIVSKSMSDSAVGTELQTVPQRQASKAPKLTLFNKDYGISIPRECKDDAEEEDENSISFVKPKSSTSTIFCLNKKKDSSKTKLALMLSFLRGDESKDEVDSISSSKNNVNTEKIEEDKESKSANLSTSTVVTFSTATTTSVLNTSTVPSSTVSTNPLESIAKDTETSKEDSKNETIPKPLMTFSPMPAAKPALSTAQTKTNNEQAKNEQTVTIASSFTVPTIPKSPTSPNKTIVSLNTTETSQRLGGFAFSANQTSQSSSNGSNTLSNSVTTQSGSMNTSLAPTFSFGAPKPSIASSSSTTPTFNFGSTKADESPKGTSTLSSSDLNSSAAIVSSNNAFKIGTLISKPAQPESNKISFTLPTTNTMSTVQSAPVTSSPAGFSFGNPASSTNAKTSSETLPTNTGSSVFAFGSNTSNDTQAASPFSVKSPSTSLPTFGSATNTNNSAPQFGNSQLTANNPVFGNNNNTSASKISGGRRLYFCTIKKKFINY